MTWTRAIAAALLLTLFSTLVALLTSYPVPDDPPAVFDLDRLRAIAGSDGPVELRTAKVIAGALPAAFTVRGGGLSMQEMPVYPVEAVWSDGSSAVIDAPGDEACLTAFAGPPVAFDPAAYRALQAAMSRAAHVVITHEHYDHDCAIAQAPDLTALGPKLRLTHAQLDGHNPLSALTDAVRAVATPLDLTGPTRLAPGLVLVPAPGHTAGSLWVYVRQAQGAEWLFVGDTAWTERSLDWRVAKPALLGLLGLEDGPQQAAYVGFLADLRAQHPSLRVMVAHEGPAWEQALADGALKPW